MPSFVLHTNLPFSSMPENFKRDATDFIASVYEKDLKRIRILLHADQAMCIAGNEAPCCMATFSCAAKYTDEQRQHYAQKITDYLSSKLKISSARIFLQFYEVPKDMIAVNGEVFSCS